MGGDKQRRGLQHETATGPGHGGNHGVVAWSTAKQMRRGDHSLVSQGAMNGE